MANSYAEVVSHFIAEKMETDKPCLISSALVPSAPSSPNKIRNITMGFLIGVLLACVYVMIRMVLDDKIKTAEDILRYTDLPTLAVVPVEKINNTSKLGK
jgi:capsular polysaccharide biosynthesis protein